VLLLFAQESFRTARNSFKDELTGKRFTFFKDPDDLPLEIYEN
jgi:glyoxylase I family protein